MTDQGGSGGDDEYVGYLAGVGVQIDEELRRDSDQVMSLSPQARVRLERAHAAYLEDMAIEAIRLARRHGLDTVDEIHVDAAAEQIGGPARESAVVTTANTVGGVVAGAGLASVYAVVFAAGPHTTSEIVTAVLLSVVGFVLLAIALTVSVTSRRS